MKQGFQRSLYKIYQQIQCFVFNQVNSNKQTALLENEIYHMKQ